MRPLTRALLVVGCAACTQCSLLAPDDRYFLGAGGGAGGSGGSDIEVACTPAPACDDAPGAGPIVMVGVDEAGTFPALVANAEPNTTFTLAEGTYNLSEVISVKAPGITLQGQPGADVVLESSAPVAIAVSANDVTLRGLTLRGASDSTVLLGGGKDVIIERPRLCNVQIVDGGQSFVRSTADGGWVDCGRVEASSFTLTDEGRASRCGTGSIVSALSVAGGRGWVVTDSEVIDFFCSSPSPPVAPGNCDLSGGVGMAFDLGSRDTLIERTRFIGASRAIVLGYTTTPTAPRAYADNPYNDSAIDHFDGTLRNNVIVGHPLCFDTGIELNHAREPAVVHNTVIYLQEPGYSAIDRRYTETHAALINNLVYGPITFRNNAPVETDVGTVELAGLGNIFASPSTGDCHLQAGASTVIDKGVASDLAGLDIDGEAHEVGSAPDVGADEYSP